MCRERRPRRTSGIGNRGCRGGRPRPPANIRGKSMESEIVGVEDSVLPNVRSYGQKNEKIYKIGKL